MTKQGLGERQRGMGCASCIMTFARDNICDSNIISSFEMPIFFYFSTAKIETTD